MITVYSKPDCIQCKMTKQFLEQHDIPFEEINVEEDAESLAELKFHGYFGLPVVAINNSFDFAFSGFQIDLLNELVEE